jgi:hypothetical protein
MERTRNANRILAEKSEGMGLLGISRHKWEINMDADLKYCDEYDHC